MYKELMQKPNEEEMGVVSCRHEEIQDSKGQHWWDCLPAPWNVTVLFLLLTTALIHSSCYHLILLTE